MYAYTYYIHNVNFNSTGYINVHVLNIYTLYTHTNHSLFTYVLL